VKTVKTTIKMTMKITTIKPKISLPKQFRDWTQSDRSTHDAIQVLSNYRDDNNG
jgi:hypothetical protein